MQSALEATLTRTLVEDRLEQAERFRHGNVTRHADVPEESYESVTVRRSNPDDGPALSRLAERDGRPVPPGLLLVAEVGGLLIAARSLEDGASLTDPFHPTTHLVELLALRSAHLRGAVVSSPQRRLSGARAFARRLVFFYS